MNGREKENWKQSERVSEEKKRKKMIFIPCFYNPLNNFPMLADILFDILIRI